MTVGQFAAVFERARAAGRKPPDLPPQPVLTPWQAIAWRCFHEVHSCRPYSLDGPQAIPWDKVCLWASRWDMSQDEEDELIELVTAIDDEWLKHVAKQREAKVGK